MNFLFEEKIMLHFRDVKNFVFFQIQKFQNLCHRHRHCGIIEITLILIFF